jgi:hypothetical protein
MISRAADASPAFPPFEHAAVKATACELVSQTHQPLSRQSTTDITRRVNDVIHRPLSASSVWRIVRRDALQPWRYRSWIFPREVHCGPKAAAILDVYAGLWKANRLGTIHWRGFAPLSHINFSVFPFRNYMDKSEVAAHQPKDQGF